MNTIDPTQVRDGTLVSDPEPLGDIPPLVEPAPRIDPAYRVRLVPAAARLWRVVTPDGRALGHLEAVGDAAATRYAAKRFHVASRLFRNLGEFWSAEDAVQTLVFAS